MASPELWVGIECTVNRVGDRYSDQVELSGHARRLSDLDLLPWLGARAIRIGILWERTAPDGLATADWSWADERLNRLRELGVRPIVGLVHHGSGPRDTSLLDPRFPARLAEFARAVAERYPWIEDWTPVNEPLTTARFSALYGHWYPHARDNAAFVAALLNQVLAVRESMRAIRTVNPAARLVQTEDLGKVHSTPELRYQADFENERRWISFDLLCGRVDDAHPLARTLLDWGADQAALASLREDPCPPDILGINHYVTSERWLDQRLDLYPPCTYGDNGRVAYADVESVRVGPMAGPRVLLREAWERYRLPIAVTEAHLGCTREEQMRWFRDIWESARSLADEGVDIRAVTAWSLLGAFDWDRLLTVSRGSYEVGAFDVRSGRPRPTGLARLLRNVGHGEPLDHPVLAAPGWWRRDIRLLHPDPAIPSEPVPDAMAPLLVIGATGTLGRAMARIAELRGLRCVAVSRSDLCGCDAESVRRVLRAHRPWAVVNAAGYVRVDDAENDREACTAANVRLPAAIARACAELGLPMLTFSSDLVFNGRNGVPYGEDDLPDPLNHYGRTKAEAEAAVADIHPDALIVRTAAFFGPWDQHNMPYRTLLDAAAGAPVRALSDVTISPTYVPHLANAALDLLVDGERGVWHLANRGQATWLELATATLRIAGQDPGLVDGLLLDESNLPAPRPRFTPLRSARGIVLPDWDAALAAWWEELDGDLRACSCRGERMERPVAV